jgi:photosystem II stability/assembly factor-like uncharacterized protein
MRQRLLSIIVLLCCFQTVSAQNAWILTQTPGLTARVDDLFMLNPVTGYAVCGDGKIMKTIDGGSTWVLLQSDTTIYCRSVEFINEKKGFVGGLPLHFPPPPYKNILRETLDGGDTWIDLTPKLNVAATYGICGLDVADSNTIYGCGNWYDTTGAYVIKSSDGGANWSFINMGQYASNLIDMYFTSKDTGFVTGTSHDASRTAVILYTTDGGITWTTKFKNNTSNELCWKIQHLTDSIYYASIEEETLYRTPTILKSYDGGMTWNKISVARYIIGGYMLQGVGFIDGKTGFTGGDFNLAYSFESKDGRATWQRINICPGMDRVFRVNDTLLFATGRAAIWRYSPKASVALPQGPVQSSGAFISCYPNPASGSLTVNLSLVKPTQAVIILFDYKGSRVKLIDNSFKNSGSYSYLVDTRNLISGSYLVFLQTHDDVKAAIVVVAH